MLDEAAAAVMKSVRVVRDHDVPYISSCSRDGKTTLRRMGAKRAAKTGRNEMR